MKQSGIDWIGEIPDDWKIIRLKHIFQIKKDIAGKEGFTVLSVTQTGIRPKDMSSKGQFALDYSKYQLVKSGEFIMNHMDLKTGWIDISKYDGVTSPDYRVFYLTDSDCIKDYYKQIFQYCYKNLIFFSLGQGVADLGRWRLPAEMFNNFNLPLPPKATQQRIAEYLDKKVSEIDSIIEESKKSIEEYKAWKQSVIFEAVTGKNLNCKKKDSGIEWIGEIPEDWKVRKVKYSTKLISGYPFDSNVLTHSGKNIVIRIGDIKNGTVDIANANKSDFEIDGLSNFAVEKDDVLVAMSGATVGKLGYIHTPIKNAYINQRVGILRSSNSKFLYYALNTDKFIEYIMLKSNGSAQPNISNDDIKNYPICVPPLPEQESIAKKLDSKCAQIDSLIAEKESLIEDLTEYKKSLIFEVVTGKRSV